MSSIRDYIDGYSLANEIRLSRSKFKGSFFLVEGVSDKNFFLNFCDNQVCSIIPCNGKKNLLDAIKDLDRTEFCGALGFADRDFTDDKALSDYKGKIVFTDENDMEIMLLCSEGLDKVLNEFGNQEKINSVTSSQGKSVKELIFASASIIGSLRALSKKNNLSLSFEGMDYKFTSSNSFFLSEKSTVRHILGRTKETVNMSENEILGHVNNRTQEVTSLKNLCCGHDCIRVLGRAFKK